MGIADNRPRISPTIRLPMTISAPQTKSASHICRTLPFVSFTERRSASVAVTSGCVMSMYGTNAYEYCLLITTTLAKTPQATPNKIPKITPTTGCIPPKISETIAITTMEPTTVPTPQMMFHKSLHAIPPATLKKRFVPSKIWSELTCLPSSPSR